MQRTQRDMFSLRPAGASFERAKEDLTAALRAFRLLRLRAQSRQEPKWASSSARRARDAACQIGAPRDWALLQSKAQAPWAMAAGAADQGAPGCGMSGHAA